MKINKYRTDTLDDTDPKHSEILNNKTFYFGYLAEKKTKNIRKR